MTPNTRANILGLAGYVGFMLFLWILLSKVEAFELLYKFSRQYEGWDIDEVTMAIPGLLLAMTWFALRKSKQLRETLKEKEKINQELVEANDRITALTKGREDFIAIAFHELGNSVNSVSATLELAELAESKEEAAEYFAMTKTLSRGLHQYSIDILSIVRQILDDATEPPEKFRLHQVMDDALAPTRVRAQQKELALTVDIDPALPATSQGNPKLIRHIVQNLAENSVKYTNTGWIRVHCGPMEASKVGIALTISDTGPGIPPELRESIFNAYDRGHQKDCTGAGIGLFIVSRLIQSINGSIAVMDNEPNGTIFKVIIPNVR